MAVENIRWTIDQGGPRLLLVFDGVEADIHHRQNLPGYVVVGPWWIWEDRLKPVELPADAATGRSFSVLRSVTSDPDVLAAFAEFRAAVLDGSFEAGPRDA